MNNEELITAIRTQRANSLGAGNGDLKNEIADALDHYHGRPYGDEQEGRSAYVSRDLSETIDWVLPPIIETFMRSNPVEFGPGSEDDEEKAQQETDYINHVLLKDNDGFTLLHDAVKDALMLKNGYWKHWWDESEKIEEQEYEELTEMQLVLLMQELAGPDVTDVEIKEQEERQILITDPTTGEQIPTTVYDVCLKIKKKVQRCVVEAIPREEVYVSNRCRGNTQDSPFTEHRTTKTRSELIEMGMSKEFVNDLPSYSDDEGDEVNYARNSVEDEDNENNNTDRSQDLIDYSEAYIRVDYDDDGVSELRKVISVAGKIPPGKEWNEVVNSVAITGVVVKRMPHRHVGESLDDDLADLQMLNTYFMRALVDNAAFTNNTEWLVNNRVHLPDFMESTPGGVKRVDDDLPVDGAASPLQVRPIIQDILPVMEHVKNIKEHRTGVDAATTGLNPDMLSNITKGAYLENLNKASQKVMMMIRMIAETGFKPMVLQVRQILMEHQDIKRTVRLRGKFVEVNPTDWKERTDLTVKVGLGNGTQEEMRVKLMLMADVMERANVAGIVGPDQAYNMASEIAETLGFPNGDRFVLDPKGEEFALLSKQRAESESNPLAEAEQVRGQMNLQIQQVKQQADAQVQAVKLDSEARFKQAEMEFKAQIELIKEQQNAEMESLKLGIDASQKEAQMRHEKDLAILKEEAAAFREGLKMDIGKPGLGSEVSRTYDPESGQLL